MFVCSLGPIMIIVIMMMIVMMVMVKVVLIMGIVVMKTNTKFVVCLFGFFITLQIPSLTFR